MINRSRKSDLYHFKLLFDFYFRLFSYIVSIMNYRFKLENLALKKRIKHPHEKNTEALAELLLLNELLNKREVNIIVKNLDIKKPHKVSSDSLINVFRRFLITKKLNDLGLNKLSKRYVSINELDRIEKLIYHIKI